MYTYDNTGFQSFCAAQTQSTWFDFGFKFQQNPASAMASQFTISPTQLAWYQNLPAPQVNDFFLGCMHASYAVANGFAMDYTGVSIIPSSGTTIVIIHTDWGWLPTIPPVLGMTSFWIEHKST